MKQLPHYWPFVRGIHRSLVNSPHKGQWREALMFSLIWAWTNGWVNNRNAGDLRRHCAYHDVTIMKMTRKCSLHGLTFWSYSIKGKMVDGSGVTFSGPHKYEKVLFFFFYFPVHLLYFSVGIKFWKIFEIYWNLGGIGFGDNTNLLWWNNVNNHVCQLTTRVSYQRGSEDPSNVQETTHVGV